MSKCSCGYYPTIILPGIGHSRVELVDSVGNSLGYVFPPEIDTKALLKRMLPPIIKMCVTKNTEKHIPALKKAVFSALETLSISNEGVPVFEQRVESYPYPISDFTEQTKRYIYACVPLQDLAEVVGENHLFFYAFNSFGQPYEAAEGLNRYIQFVKRLTGHDKVNLIAISLGGCVSVAYLDCYAHKGDIHRLINFVPAINGTSFVADIMDNNLCFDAPEELFELLMGHNESVQTAAMLKKLPEKVYYAALEAIIDVIRENIILNCPNMWGTVPKQRYTELRDKYLTDSSHRILLAKADRLHRAHLNYEENVNRAREAGTEFFNLCGYGLKLISLSKTNTVSSDGVIDLSGASAFAYSAPFGETFPDGYKQKNIYCKDKKHNHISPDRTVDASAGLFPETTWYFKEQFHDAIAYNDAALMLCREILTNDSFKDVYSSPRFPQFNGCRNTKHLRHSLIPRAKQINREEITLIQAAELTGALEDARAFLDCTVIDEAPPLEPVVKRLEDILGDISQGQ